MRRLIIAATVLLVTTTAAASPLTENTEQLFEDFKIKYSRHYASPAEEERRFAIFAANMRQADEMNRLNPYASFGATKFADISLAEFEAKYPSTPITSTAHQDRRPEDPTAPFSGCNIDWREKGVVTPVKDEHKCISGWAFSAVGNIEGQWALAGHKLTSLSAQELVSCDTAEDGCTGPGNATDAITWLLKNTGGKVAPNTAYPFSSGSGTVPPCIKDLSRLPVGAVIKGLKVIDKTNNAVADFLCNKGPVSVMMSTRIFSLYQGGLLTHCKADRGVVHGALLIGLDSSYKVPYWTVKNQWGPDWGEDGYLRAGLTANCAITQDPISAIV